MKITIVFDNDRVNFVNNGDCGKSAKNRVGCKSGTLTQRITIDVPYKVNGKWKTLVTGMLMKHNKLLVRNCRPVTFIKDDAIRAENKYPTFSIRDIPSFVNVVANYILRMRRAERNDYGNVTMAGVLALAKKLK